MKTDISRSRIYLSRILFAMYLAAILFLILIHPDSLPNVSRLILGLPTDKVAHFLLFLPFPVLSFLSWGKPLDKYWQFLLFTLVVIILGSGVGAFTEYLQSLTSYRTADRADFITDTLAVISGGVIVLLADAAARCKTEKRKKK